MQDGEIVTPNHIARLILKRMYNERAQLAAELAYIQSRIDRLVSACEERGFALPVEEPNWVMSHEERRQWEDFVFRWRLSGIEL